MDLDRLVQTVPRPPDEYAWAWALERDAFSSLRIQIVTALSLASRALPREDELILWFGIPQPGAEAALTLLSDDERGRADNLRRDNDRLAFIASRAALRQLLAPMLAAAPLALRFLTTGRGKPRLDCWSSVPDVQFSISHTCNCLAIAVAASAVGIDVERRRIMPDLLSVAGTAFGPEAQAALAARRGCTERTALFYRCWTLGEAFVKATGEGMAQDFASFAFTEHGVPALTRVTPEWGPVGRWRFGCDDAASGHVR